MISQDLIQDFKDGNPVAFKMLYAFYYNDIWSLCYKYSKSREVAEELAHDAFLLLWQNHYNINPQQGIKPYLLTIARNEVFRWLKKNASDGVMKEELKKQYLDHQEKARQDKTIDAVIDLRYLKTFIKSFPSKRRKVFELIKFADLSYGDVAEQLCISRDAVKDHMIKANKAILKLKKPSEFIYQLFLLSFLLLN